METSLKYLLLQPELSHVLHHPLLVFITMMGQLVTFTHVRFVNLGVVSGQLVHISGCGVNTNFDFPNLTEPVSEFKELQDPIDTLNREYSGMPKSE